MNKNNLLLSAILLFTSACSTLNESMQLGATLGAASGAAATYTARTSMGQKAEFDDVAAGAAIGLGVGLITSYLVHGQVTDGRNGSSENTEMFFGDLPPSPFVFPKSTKKGGQ